MLYLEWFSRTNGRVVVEIPEADIDIKGDPTWRMTEEETEQQQHDMLNALDQFMEMLDDSLEDDPPEEEGMT